jgi:TolB-like protein/Flp pilus assembly protein TadD
MLIGTPHYMSPEQALGRPLDPRSDLFSLGVILYELITGQRPFLGSTVGETINNIINQPAAPLGVENVMLEQVIGKCLAKNPDERYGSAKALIEDLIVVRGQIERSAEVPNANEKTLPSQLVNGPGTPTGLPISEGPRRKKPALVLAIAGLSVLLVLGSVLWLMNRGQTGINKAQPGPAPVQNSIAVLPFDNFSAEPDTEYLSDGLTEEITTALSRIAGLKVAARNSAFTFKGRKEDARKVGAALQVTKLLEGSIQKVGKRIHVNAQLINVADGFHLWSETYDRSEEDTLGVQEDIARRIAERLALTVTANLSTHKPIEPEAYKSYLQARVFWNKRTRAGLEQAVKLFQQAIQKQPDYAEAYAGLAATYHIMPEYSPVATFRECAPLARSAANRALELDPSCAEAHAVLGNLQAAPPARDFKGAEQHFKRAMELDPSYATAHHWYGRYLLLHGDMDKALKEFETAVDLDPLSPSIRSTIPNWYYVHGDFDRAISECRKVMEAFPDFPPVRMALTMACFMKNDYQQALQEIDANRALQPQDPLFCLEFRGYALARLNRTDESQKILQQLLEEYQQGKPIEASIGFLYIGQRDYDKALDYLEKAVARDGLPEEFFRDPFMDQLRNLPRVQAILKKVETEQVTF